MAATGYTPISLYYSATSTNVPTAGNLVAGELAINTADGKLFYKDSAGVVQVIGTKGGVGSSSTTQVLYNSSGLVVGSANMTFNGTTLTLANDASISGLTVGKGGGSINNNTALGASALAGANSGNGYNTAIGANALTTNTTGAYQVAIGGNALFTANGTNYNTAIGYGAGYSTTTGDNNVIMGRSAMYNNTTGGSNTAIGISALVSNTTASNNTAVGYQSCYTNTTGYAIVGIGQQALYANTTGINNSAVGYQAGYSNTTGSYNTSLGRFAGYTNSTGVQNTFIGDSAGQYTTSSYNTFVGQGSGFAVTSGAKNSILGMYSGNQGGLDIRTASNYIVLSDGDGNPRGYFDGSANYYQPSGNMLLTTGTLNGNGITISPNASTADNYMMFNNTASSATNVYFRYSGTTVGSISRTTTTTSYNITSDRRLKENIAPLSGGLASVLALKPSQYNYISDPSTQIQGFIADELQQVVPHAVTGKANAVDAEGKPVYQGVDASFLIPHLVAAIQEQQAIIEQLKAKVGL
jgi:hypothetical protein